MYKVKMFNPLEFEYHVIDLQDFLINNLGKDPYGTAYKLVVEMIEKGYLSFKQLLDVMDVSKEIQNHYMLVKEEEE